VGPDGSIAGTWSDDPSIPEGTPVVNQRGELVALCSHRSGSSVRGSAAGVPHLVVLETLDDIRQALSALQGTAPVWLGVVINDDPGGALSVGAVDPAGPAHAGGLTAGDVILAVDDDQITDGRALIAHLGLHRPGDVVRIAIRHADGTKAVIAITLAAPKTAL
ncbi:MAG: PDZ domain-containing protein, partial [Actinomycetota bacterium]